MRLKLLAAMLLMLVSALIQGCAQTGGTNGGGDAGANGDTHSSYSTIEENHQLNVDHR